MCVTRFSRVMRYLPGGGCRAANAAEWSQIDPEPGATVQPGGPQSEDSIPYNPRCLPAQVMEKRALGMSGPKLIVQPDDGEKPVVNFLKSVRKTVALKQFTFTHPILLDTVMALHQKGVRVRVMLNGAKTTGERLNDPFFETMKSTESRSNGATPASWSRTRSLSSWTARAHSWRRSTSWKSTSRPPATTGVDQRSGPGRAGAEMLRLRLETRTISSARRRRTLRGARKMPVISSASSSTARTKRKRVSPSSAQHCLEVCAASSSTV